MKKVLKSIGWIMAYLATYLVFQLTYSIVGGFIIAIRTELLGSNGNTEEAIDAFVKSQIPQSIIFAGIISFLVYYIMVSIRNKKFMEECKFKPLSGKHGLASGLLGVSGLAISSLLLAALAYFLDTAYIDHMENMEAVLGGNKALVFLSVGVAAPIIEEIIFRGLIFTELERHMNVKAVVVVQALLFGIYHLNVAQGVYTSFLGVILGLSLLWTNSIWAPIIVHMVNNSLSFLLSLGGVESNIFLFGVGIVMIFGIITFPIILGYLYRTRANKPFAG